MRTAMKSTDAMYGIGMGTINLATILGALSMGAAAKKMRMETCTAFWQPSPFCSFPWHCPSPLHGSDAVFIRPIWCSWPALSPLP